MAAPAPKRSLRGRVPRQFSEPFLSDEQVKVMMGRAKRLKPENPVLPAIDCINHRLSRDGRQQYLVGWADESIEPSWEDVDDISMDIVGAYQDVMAEKCPLMPTGTDVSWILKQQMNALMFEIQKELRTGFVPFKQSRTTTFHSVASTPMCPEGFLRLFAPSLPPGTTPRSLLAGAKVQTTFAEARTLLDPFLAGWFRLSRADHFVSEVDPEAPLTFTFKLKWQRDYDHTACLKCNHPWTLREITNGIAPSKCCFLVTTCKQCATFLDLSFKHSFLNGTRVHRDMLAASKAVSSAAAAAATVPAAPDPAPAIADTVLAAAPAVHSPAAAVEAVAEEELLE